ncbi:chlororespiratory reduction protein 7 [Synechocystis sp. PCC 7509]|uniref:chlororespiratory reduction protein 7 n=1 Tax=Synechocystis sp. PCC 7509 TaxID=927677 RepID=UPI0002AD0072|nr:chlororespiratory reduction protein 7 [Synechocystis sp. PCC 7509]
MPDPMMYQQDDFVVLEPNQQEQFLTANELLEKLKVVLAHNQHKLPQELQTFSSIEEQASYLINTSCELVLEPGQYLQWYAVRLEK